MIPQNPRVLIVGGGAREHAIAYALSRSPYEPELLAAPGNPGMEEWCACVDIKADDVQGLVRFAERQGIQLVVIGPEVPLSKGLVDACEDVGLLAFGPSQAAARLEASKAFAKSIMESANVPTAKHKTFTHLEDAKVYLEAHGAPVVIKADGLAAGKGVVVAMQLQEALTAVEEMMGAKRFGDAGNQVVIEDFLEGEEASMMYFIDGETIRPMLPARDFKRIGDGDTGPNTGGMGSFAPVPGFDDELISTVTERIVRPTLGALAAQGITYRGVLYVGLMLTGDGPYVVEFNARFGDPETEVVLPLLGSDLLEICWATATGQLADVDVVWKSDAAVCVVAASEGYPQSPVLGDTIEIAERQDEAGTESIVFHAGTAWNDNGALVTAGGRVLTAVGRAGDGATARSVAYQTVDAIYFRGKQVRRDIAAKL